MQAPMIQPINSVARGERPLTLWWLGLTADLKPLIIEDFITLLRMSIKRATWLLIIRNALFKFYKFN